MFDPQNPETWTDQDWADAFGMTDCAPATRMARRDTIARRAAYRARKAA